jgi:hypothetical protein
VLNSCVEFTTKLTSRFPWLGVEGRVAVGVINVHFAPRCVLCPRGLGRVFTYQGLVQPHAHWRPLSPHTHFHLKGRTPRRPYYSLDVIHVAEVEQEPGLKVSSPSHLYALALATIVDFGDQPLDWFDQPSQAHRRSLPRLRARGIE